MQSKCPEMILAYMGTLGGGAGGRWQEMVPEKCFDEGREGMRF